MDFKLRDFRYPVSILKMRRHLEHSQWWPKEKLEAWQNERLRFILKHAQNKVPFWRRRFADYGFNAAGADREDLGKLPLLDKEDIRAGLSKMLCEDWRSLDTSLHRTGGTTGTPMEFYVDKASNVAEFSLVWRHWNWAGYRFGDRFCDLRGRILKGEKPWAYDWRLNSLMLSSYRLTRALVKDYARQLRRFKPVLLRGYPSAIDFFARLLREEGIDDIRPKAVVTSSETLLAHMRSNLEAVFGCPVYDTYGLEERVAAGGQCPAGSMHEDSEYGFIEIVREDGAPAGPGEVGEIVATGFHNLAMPLIRYRTHDLARRALKPCACGRGLPVLESLEGRVEDMISTPDGRCVSGAGLSVAIKRSLGIRRSQIIQESRDEMTVKVVRAAGYCEVDERLLLEGLRDRVGPAIRIKLEFVDDLELTKHGKLKFVIAKKN